MNVLIAQAAYECEGWKGLAVVVDVLRTTTTICALLAKQNRVALVCKEAGLAGGLLSVYPDLAVFSEQPLKIPHEDNSPYLAERLPEGKTALVVSAELFKAIKSLKTASNILLGGFCNFYTLADTIAALGQDVLLVPSSLFALQEEEDNLCITALKDCLHGSDRVEKIVEEFKKTMRMAEFKNKGFKTANKDLKHALKIDAIRVVPQVILSKEGHWGVCAACGSTLEETWLDETRVQIPEEEPLETLQAPPEETSAEEDESAAELQRQRNSALMDRVSLTEEYVPTQQDTPSAAQAHPTLDAVETAPQDKSISSAQKDSVENKEVEMPQLGKAKASEVSGEGKETADEKTAPTQAPAEKQTEAKPVVIPAQKPVKKERPAWKSFLSGLADSIKKEKQELEQTFRQQPKTSRREDMPAQHFADPMDQLLNGQPEMQNPAEQETQTDKKTTEKSVANLEEKTTANPEGKPMKNLPISENKSAKNKKAIVLLSGGLDSTTCLYWAISQGYTCEALSISYGQRHEREIVCAKKICEKLGVKHQAISLNLPWLAASSLVDAAKPLPDIAVEQIPHAGIPSTYVPGRNLMFLALAGSLLDVVGADAIVAGPNAIDFSGYPDCTPAFFKAAADALNRGTSRGVSEGIEVLAPLMRLSKAEIVKLANELGVPFELTWSCYAGGEKPCGKCDSCKLRAKGFEEAGVHDTALD